MGNASGTATKFGFAQITSSPAWTTGQPKTLGANNGFEYDSDSMQPNADMVLNEGITGALFQKGGSIAGMKPEATIPFDAYYRCGSLAAIAGAFGLDSITTSGGKTLHSITPQATDALKFGTLASFDDPTIGIGVREFPMCKVKTLNLSCSESQQRAKWEATFIGNDYRLNVGTANAAFVVASVAAANGALTITAGGLADFNPSPLTFTKAAGVTAITVVIVYIDRFNIQRSITIATADFVSNVWTGTDPARRVVSATVSGLSGTGNISMGVTNGANNESNRSSVSIVADRDVLLFGGMEVLLNAQSAGALSSTTDEQCISELKFGLELNHDQRITACSWPGIDEPTRGGSGSFATVTLDLTFSAVGSGQRQRILDIISKDQLKGKVTFTGPTVSGSSPAVPHTFVIWLNGLQLKGDAPVVTGPGVMPMSLSLQAFTVGTLATGFPTGFTHAAAIELTNGETTAYWS